MDKLTVTIIGAGIGGLTAGIALSQAGYDVTISDRVSELKPVGAGISLWSNGAKVLNRLGLGIPLAAIGGLMTTMQYRTKTGELLSEIDLNPLVQQVGQRPYPVARRDLQALLLRAFPGEVRLGHTCTGVVEDERGVTALFANGHEARGDLLVAADGIRSRLRSHVLGETVEPQYGGYVNWNGLVAASADLAAPEHWVIYVGEHKQASLMPVAGDRFYFFLDVPLPAKPSAELVYPEQYQAELRQYFQGWAEPVQRLIERLDPLETRTRQSPKLGTSSWRRSHRTL